MLPFGSNQSAAWQTNDATTKTESGKRSDVSTHGERSGERTCSPGCSPTVVIVPRGAVLGHVTFVVIRIIARITYTTPNGVLW